MSVQIIELPVNDDKKRELVGYLYETFKKCVDARINQVEGKYTRWIDNYAGKPAQEIRTTPFLHASNFMPNLIRMHSDILVARLYGILMSAKPFWRPKTMIEGVNHETMEGLSDFMEFLSFFQICLPTVLDSCLRRVVKCGTMFMKGPWIKDEFYWPALTQDGKAIDGTLISKESLQLQPLPFEDFWAWPITANNLDECKVVFHRLRYTKRDIEDKKASGLWAETACDKLLQMPERQPDTASQTKANEAGITLKPDTDRPYSAVEAHFRYQLQTGQVYKLIITFNPQDQTETSYLRGYFSPYRNIENCFCDLTMMPREDLLYGYSVPEILEQFQEEQAQIHNARRDYSLVANCPGWKKKRDPNVPNPASEWYPGRVFELDNMEDIAPLTFGGQYNSMIDEEGFLLQLAERTTGISPPMQGAGAGGLSGKRGIYASQGVLALLAEGNRRIDIYLKRMRYPMHKLGNLIYQSYRTFRPQGAEYKIWGANGNAITRTFSFTEPTDYNGFFFEMGASDGSANKETDRTALLLMANTMAAYYRQVVEAAATLQQAGPNTPLGQTLLLVLDGAKDLADRLLFSFDIGDRKRLVPDLRQLLGGSPRSGAEQAESVGMPPTEEPLSLGGVQDLSQRLSQIAGAGPAGPGGGQRPQ